MANPTTYFGWVMPTSSSLVTNLPADFNTFGQGVDTSLQDLLGGTTGQVLSKTSATNMDFTWVTPTDQTPLTTKGDLFTFTTVDARLAVGNNGESLYADSAATTGLRYSATPSASNPVLNSAMQVWQRGTSVAAGLGVYAADRWLYYFGGTGTVTRQTTSDTTNLPAIQYCSRVQRTAANTTTSSAYYAQSFESINSIPFAGKTVTLSFYARAGANYSPTSSLLVVTLSTGTGTDQNVITGAYTGQANPIQTSATLTTTWQRFTYTGTLSASMTEMALYFQATPVGTAGAADYFEVTGVQIDIGSVALPFRTYLPTIAGELAACQRYYFRTTGGEVFANGIFFSGTKARVALNCPVTMRTDTGAIDFNNLWLADGSSTYNATAVGYYYYGKQVKLLEVDVASGGTASRPVYLSANAGSSASYIGVTAEL